MTDPIKKLLKESKSEPSWGRRLTRKILFSFGFSKCRYCIYFKYDGPPTKGYQESILMTEGSCHWAKNYDVTGLDVEDIRKFHRCPGFVEMMYNFKGYAIDSSEIKRISDRRRQNFVTWGGWILAIILVILQFLLSKNVIS